METGVRALDQSSQRPKPSSASGPDGHLGQLDRAVEVLSAGLAILDDIGLTVAAAHVSMGLESANTHAGFLRNKPNYIENGPNSE